MRVFFIVLALATSTLAQTIVIDPVKELKPTGSLGTCDYKASTGEQPFINNLPHGEGTTGSFMEEYSIHKKTGKSVGWFGVVRGIAAVGNEWEIVIEEKAFDGLSDCHIMMVSWAGDGDFRARLKVEPKEVPLLSLIRIYGRVSSEVEGVPTVQAEFIRVWPWGAFTFTDLGPEDHGNPRWKKYCRLCKGEARIYQPYPRLDYYRGMLGDPEEFAAVH